MRGAAVALLCLLACGAARAGAAVRLELDGRATATALVIQARNAGDSVATAVAPDVAYQHHQLTGEAVSLPPGDRHEWSLPLPPSSGPGTFAAIAHVRYDDGDTRATAPLVVLVPVPTAPPSDVTAALDVAPGPGLGTARVSLDNRGARPLAGRIAFVLPSVLHTEPESQPVQVPPHDRRVVPAAVEDRGARDDASYPLWAVLDYDDDGIHYAVAAHTEARARPDGGARTAPLAVGAVALGIAVAVVTLASRAVARRRRAAG